MPDPGQRRVRSSNALVSGFAIVSALAALACSGGAGVDGGSVAGGSAAGGSAAGGSAAGGSAAGGSAAGGSAAGGSAAGGSAAGGSAAGGSALDAGARPPLDGGSALGAISFTVNGAGNDDYGRLTQLPPGFGSGEFTFEMWIRPDPSFAVGPCVDGTAGQLQNWCSPDPAPYSSSSWWFKGNFLIDGHNNSSFSAGTFSLQFYGAGRVRWTLGDQGSAGAGNIWAVQARPATGAPSLLDGGWHHLACIRRWQGATQSRLELWVDGVLTGTETSDVRTDMTTLWSTWSSFPNQQPGWFFGAEKQAAIGVLGQYEDYKGLVTELRFWTRPLAAAELAPPAFRRALIGTEAGLVGWFRFGEGAGNQACDQKGATRCLTFFRQQQPFWR